MHLNSKARITGAVPVLVMPFDSDGTIDEESLRREIGFCVEAGAQAIAFGMGRESAMLTDAERAQVWTVLWLTRSHVMANSWLDSFVTSQSRRIC